MKGQGFVTLCVMTIVVGMFSAIEALQCYVCDNCIEGEEFNVLEICGVNGGGIIPVGPSSTLATTIAEPGTAATPSGTTAGTKTTLVVENLSTVSEQQTDQTQEILETQEQPVTLLPTTLLTNADNKDIGDNFLEYSYEDQSGQEQIEQQQELSQQQTENNIEQQQTEQNTSQQQESTPVTTTTLQITPTMVIGTTTTSPIVINTIVESSIVNTLETTIKPMTLSTLIDSEEDNTNNNKTFNEYEYDDEREEKHETLITSATILLTNQTSSTANTPSAVSPPAVVVSQPGDHDEDYYEEYDEEYEDERKRMRRPKRGSSLRQQQLAEPVCYVIRMEVNNTLVTRRGCASLVRNEVTAEFLNCHDIYPGASVEECYLCESNGCNKVKIGSSMSTATSSNQQHYKGLLFMMIATAAIVV